MKLVLDVLSWAFLMGGSFFAVLGAFGVLRLPDVFSRAHSSGMVDTMGAGMILLGLMFQAGLTQVTIKLVLVWLFLWFTSPVSTHALVRAALHGGLKPVLHKDLRKGSE